MNGICMVEKSQAAVENDGKHPIIGFNHLSLVDFATGWWGGWDQWILKFPRDGMVCWMVGGFPWSMDMEISGTTSAIEMMGRLAAVVSKHSSCWHCQYQRLLLRQTVFASVTYLLGNFISWECVDDPSSPSPFEIRACDSWWNPIFIGELWLMVSENLPALEMRWDYHIPEIPIVTR